LFERCLERLLSFELACLGVYLADLVLQVVGQDAAEPAGQIFISLGHLASGEVGFQ
jgi:hypothetical protein